MVADGSRVSTADGLLIGALLLSFLAAAASTVCDPDMFHMLALGREVAVQGGLPLHDPFAFTPTRQPVVHHEWLLGVLLYHWIDTTGATGLLVLKYALHVLTFALALLVARRGGASLITLAYVTPLAIGLAKPGLTTLRAHVVTMCFAAATLLCIDVDRRGSRRWIVPYLALHVLWLNCHGGFVVGPALLLLHATEQAIRRKPVVHIVLLMPVLALLLLATPYGLAYPTYLWQALSMDRSVIGEWRPLGDGYPWALPIWGFSVSLFLYALLRAGLAKHSGWLIVAAAAFAAYRHQRHVSLYAIVWLAFVPPMLETSRVAIAFGRVWSGHPWLRRAVIGLGIVAALGHAARERRWHAVVPTRPMPSSQVVYPAGVVDYLRARHVTGTMVTPFELGAFVSWKLAPAIRVSLDGRYEAAYPLHLVDEHVAFYRAGSSWAEFLARYRPDLVLAKRGDPILETMRDAPPWRSAYEDDVFVVLARSALPYVDRRGENIPGAFP